MSNSTRFILHATAGAVLILAAGCAVGPNFQPPNPEVPGAWAGDKEKPAPQHSTATAAPAELARWWANFNDPKLSDLVERALAANLDVKLAEAQLRESRAARGVAAGGLWPSLNSSAAVQRVQRGTTGDNLFKTGLDALWELDVFGGKRRNVESAKANIQAAQEGLRDVQVSLAAEVALNYVQLRGFQQQIAIAKQNLAAQRHTAEITLERHNAGFVSNLDVANATAQVATTESQIPIFDSGMHQAVYALSVLLGRAPGDLLSELSEAGPLPATPPQIPVGLPSDLLRRRPDIRQAEARLHSATARIGVATADLFPKFSLTGNVGWQSATLKNLFSGSNLSAGVGPSVDWNIFQGGSIAANIRVQKAVRDESYIVYQKTVLTALQDVENALVAFAREQDRHTALTQAAAANGKAASLSRELYTQGQTDFLSVLDAQRQLYATDDAVVQSNVHIVTNLVALYKALGGGWEVPTPIAPVS